MLLPTVNRQPRRMSGDVTISREVSNFFKNIFRIFNEQHIPVAIQQPTISTTRVSNENVTWTEV